MSQNDFEEDITTDQMLRLQHRFRGDTLQIEVDDDSIAKLNIPSLRELGLNAVKLTDIGLSRLAMPWITQLSFNRCSSFTQDSLAVIAGVLPQLSGLGLAGFSRGLDISIFKHLTTLILEGDYIGEIFATTNPQAPLKTLIFRGHLLLDEGELIGPLPALGRFASTLEEIIVGGRNILSTEWLRGLEANTALKKLTMSDMKSCHAPDFRLFKCHLSHFSIRWSSLEDMMQVLERLHVDCLEQVELHGRPGPINLEPLRKATKLMHVEVTALDDLTILRGARNLRSLRVNGVGCLQMTQLSFATLSSFSNLERLELMCCPLVTSLKPLEDLRVLEGVMLSKMNGLTSLQGLPLQLKTLYVAGLSNLVDICPLPLLTQLSSLSLLQLQCLHFKDLLPLSSLSAITSLSLKGFGNTYIPRHQILTEIEIKQMNDTAVRNALSDRNITRGDLTSRGALTASEKERWDRMTEDQKTDYRKWITMPQKDKDTLAESSKISWDFLLRFPLLSCLWIGSPAMDPVGLQELVALIPSTKLRQVILLAPQEQFPADILKLLKGSLCYLGFEDPENMDADADGLPIYF